MLQADFMKKHYHHVPAQFLTEPRLSIAKQHSQSQVLSLPPGTERQVEVSDTLAADAPLRHPQLYDAQHKLVYEDERGVSCYQLQDASTSLLSDDDNFTAVYNAAPNVWSEYEEVSGSIVEEEVSSFDLIFVFNESNI